MKHAPDKRRGRPSLAACVPALALVLAGCSDSVARPRHLLLVTLDTVRADAVGHLGGRAGSTPNVDRLARAGVSFTDAWTPRGQTWPALASLLTGLHPLAHGVRENGFELPRAVPSLVEVFSREGFRTGAFLANACEAWGEYRFDYLACAQGPGELEGDQSRLQHAWDERAVEQALAWIGESKQPSFAWVHLYDAHKPFPTIPELRARYVDPAYTGPWRVAPEEVARGHRMRFHDLVDQACLAGERPSAPELDVLRAYYDAGVTSVDRHVGRLLDELERMQRLDETLVVLAADHGEELFDHGNYPYHGAALHASVLRIPLILSWPAGLPTDALCAAPVDLMDVAPTVLELFDLPAPGPMDGDSLLPFLGGAPRERALLSEVVALDLGARPPRITGEFHALRRGDWRLIWNPEALRVSKPPYERAADASAGLLTPTGLFDLRADPYEQRDLGAEQPARVKSLRGELERRLEELRARAMRAEPPRPELVETLRSLGYLGDK